MGAQSRPARASRFEQLFATLLPFLVRWTRGRLPTYARRRMDSGDLVQDAIVAALRRSGDLEQLGEDDLRRYLQTAILNRIRDEIRRASLGEITNGSSMTTRDRRPSPLDDAIETEDRVRYRAALLGLRQGDRELLVGRVDLEMSYQELALATARPTAEAARAATRRALRKLVEALANPSRTPAGSPPEEDPRTERASSTPPPTAGASRHRRRD